MVPSGGDTGTPECLVVLWGRSLKLEDLDPDSFSFVSCSEPIPNCEIRITVTSQVLMKSVWMNTRERFGAG